MIKIVTVLHLALSAFLVLFFQLYKNNTFLDLLIISFVIILSYSVSSSNILNQSDYLSLKFIDTDVYTRVVKAWHVFVMGTVMYMIYNRNNIKLLYNSNKECYDRYLKCIAAYIIFTHGNRLFHQIIN